ncbi:MAG TPA: hypothetical protein DDY21_00190 [Candidatus Moranbacteria bacterium]|nr:hypothetical protein [Candidatus Moranbacteria bacterium]
MITKSYTFTNNTVIDPEEVNQNFDDVLDEVKGSHHRDEDGALIEPADVHVDWGLVPKGGIILWSGTIATIPAHYSFCNGSNGTIDLRNKFALCAGQDSGGTYDTADTGGAATHTLTSAEMPVHTHVQNAHTHTQNAHDHTYYRFSYTAASGTSDDFGNGWSGTTSNTGSATATNQNTTATNQNAGSGGAHNNMPPYIAVVYIQLTNL